MNAIALLFLLVTAGLLLALPRPWAPLPLILAASYTTRGQFIDVGPFTFTVLRVLILVGAARVLARRERPAGGLGTLDWLMLAFGAWAVLASAFHEDPSAYVVSQLGHTYDACGVYLLLRAFVRSPLDVQTLCRITAIVLVPVAAEMLQEKLTGYNLFAVLGEVRDTSKIRDGSIRAQGPFAHAILAGSVGAAALPLVAPLWRTYPTAARLGTGASAAMVLASASSGPVLSLAAAGGALALWPLRRHLRSLRWLAPAAYVGLHLVMNAPVYYLIARLDLVSGSTGWHRAKLIDSSLAHLSEWWLAGTDHTRHWMPTGVSWSPEHSDITNHYLGLGVQGGLPLTLLFVAILAAAFAQVSRALRQPASRQAGAAFLPWALGASLFTHTVTAIGVALFDQSFAFLYAVLAAIVAIAPVPQAAKVSSRATVPLVPEAYPKVASEASR